MTENYVVLTIRREDAESLEKLMVDRLQAIKQMKKKPEYQHNITFDFELRRTERILEAIRKETDHEETDENQEHKN